MAEKLEFDVVVGKNDLNKTLKEAQTYATSMSSYFGNDVKASIESATQEAKGLNSQFSDFLKSSASVAAGAVAFTAVSTAVGFLTSSLKDSVGEFAKNEDANNKLNQSLRATGAYSEAAVYSLQAYAEQLSITSKYGGEEITTQLAFAKSLGATNEQAKQLVTAGANLAATFGGSLDENVDKLGKTLTGSAGKLAIYIPELASLTKEQLKAGQAADIINKKFSGAASSELDTYSGSVAALGASFGKLQETTGETIVKSDLFRSIMVSLKDSIDEVNSSIATGKVYEDYSKGQGIASKTSSQLAVDFQTLNREINNLEKNLAEEKGRSAFSKFILDDNAEGVIKKQIDDLVKLRADIEEKLTFSRSSIPQEQFDAPAAPIQSTAEIEAAKKRNAELLALDEQLRIERYNKKVEEENLKIEDEAVRNQAEIQRMYDFDVQKKEVEAQLKATTAQATLEGEALSQELLKIQKEKELSLLQAYNKKEIDMVKATATESTKAKKAASDEQIRLLGYVNQQTAASFGLAAALARDGSKEQFAINKAAAVAQVLIARSTGMANALLLPPPAIPAAIANANMIAGLSLATIAATAIKGYAEGGIVGGFGQGATGGGDNTVSTTRESEMYLNARQQKNLFDMINSGFAGGDIILNIDNREVARAVRTAKEEGFVL